MARLVVVVAVVVAMMVAAVVGQVAAQTRWPPEVSSRLELVARRCGFGRLTRGRSAARALE